MSDLPPPLLCSRCGTALPAEAPPGYCPRCLSSDLAGEETDAFFHPPEHGGSLEASGFILREVIGRGGMGQVYRALQTSPDREVAVKMLMPHLASSAESRRRFLVEAEAMAELDHPGILPLYAAGESDGQPWLAMKLVRGGSLAERRARYAGQWKECAALTAELADAIQHAHSRGVIHRDLKPGNILFEEEGRPCLSDFGLAKWRDDADPITLSHAVMGTFAYLAPETVEHGTRAATTAGDIYGLGAILYELLTGRPPFTGDLNLPLLRRIMEETPPAPRSLDARIPTDLEIITLKAMARNPGGRYAHATDLAADLRAWLRGDPIAARPVTLTARVVRLARRYPFSSSLLTLLFLTYTAGGLFLWRQNAALQRSFTRADKARDSSENLVAYMTEELPVRLAPAGRLDLLDGIYEHLSAYYADSAGAEQGSSGEGPSLSRRAAFQTQWSRSLGYGGKLPEALAKVEEACTLAASALTFTDTPSARAILAGAHRRRAELLAGAARRADSLAALDAADAAISAGLARYPGHFLLTLEAAEALTERAHTLLTAEDAPAARPLFLTALTRWQALLPGTTTSPILQRRVREMSTRLHYFLASAADKSGDHETRLRHCEDYYAATTALAATAPDDAAWQQELLYAANHLSLALRKVHADDTDRIESLMTQSDAIGASLTARDPANLKWRTDHAGVLNDRADQAAGRDDYPTAAALARRVQQSLPADYPPGRAARAKASELLAAAASAAADWSAAWQHYDDALSAALLKISDEPARNSPHQHFVLLVREASGKMSTPATPGQPPPRSPAEREAWCRTWLAKISAIPAPDAQAAALLGWSRASVLRRLADTLSDRPPLAAAATLESFHLRIAALQCDTLPEALLSDIPRTANDLLKNPPPGFDPLIILQALTTSAPRAARETPESHWRSAWADSAARALALLPAAPRPAAAQAVAAALFPDPPPHPWTEEDKKSLQGLRPHP